MLIARLTYGQAQLFLYYSYAKQYFVLSPVLEITSSSVLESRARDIYKKADFFQYITINARVQIGTYLASRRTFNDL